MFSLRVFNVFPLRVFNVFPLRVFNVFPLRVFNVFPLRNFNGFFYGIFTYAINLRIFTCIRRSRIFCMIGPIIQCRPWQSNLTDKSWKEVPSRPLFSKAHYIFSSTAAFLFCQSLTRGMVVAVDDELHYCTHSGVICGVSLLRLAASDFLLYPTTLVHTLVQSLQSPITLFSKKCPDAVSS